MLPPKLLIFCQHSPAPGKGPQGAPALPEPAAEGRSARPPCRGRAALRAANRRTAGVRSELLGDLHGGQAVEGKRGGMSRLVLVIGLRTDHGGVIPGEGKRRHKELPAVFFAALPGAAAQPAVGRNAACQHQLIAPVMPGRLLGLLRPIIPNNARTLRVTAAAGT